MNVAEILKDAPEGLELDSLVYGACKLVKADDKSITTIDNISGETIVYDLYGKLKPNGSCVLFPPRSFDKTWNHWQKYIFKKGDIIVLIENHYTSDVLEMGICKNITTEKSSIGCCKYETIVTIDFRNNKQKILKDQEKYYADARFANQKEKEEFLNILKKNGFIWNDVDKTLTDTEKFKEFSIKVGNYYRCIDKFPNSGSEFNVGGIYLSNEDDCIVDNKGVSYNFKDEKDYNKYFVPWYSWTIEEAIKHTPVMINNKIFIFDEYIEKDGIVYAYFGFDQDGNFHDTRFEINNPPKDIIKKPSEKDLKSFIKELNDLGYIWRDKNETFLIPKNYLTINKGCSYLCIQDYKEYSRGKVYYSPENNILVDCENNKEQSTRFIPYLLDRIPSNFFKLWTIKNAKLGDILSENGVLFVYSGKIDENENPIALGYLDLDDKFKTGNIEFWEENYILKIPTTDKIEYLLSKVDIKSLLENSNKKEEIPSSRIVLEGPVPFNLEPFDKVIVRLNDSCVWKCDFFSYYIKDANSFMCSSGCYCNCLPYTDKTKNLIGTTNNYEKS